MKIALLSVLTLCTIMGGVYVGLCITDKKIVKREGIVQVLTFSCVFVLVNYLKYLNDVLVPVDNMLVKALSGDKLMCFTMFAVEMFIMIYFFNTMLTVLKINARRLLKGYLKEI